MAIAFRRVSSAPLDSFEAAAPDGAVIGIVGEENSGASQLLRVAAGLDRPSSGSVEVSGATLYIAPGDALEFDGAPVLLIDQAFGRHDWLQRERASIGLDRARRNGATALIASHDEELLRRLADEIWWLREGKLAGRGDPDEILSAYRKHLAARLRIWGESVTAPLSPRMRRGDGRAEVLRVETLGESGAATMLWRSGELATIRITVRFRDAVADPVGGIMIRTRVGLNVYGTNTELERLKLGPCAAGQTLVISFAFRCELCPGDYTLTVASHDPDGVWHDWLEDAVAFSVTDNRYTAGVANLRAHASYNQL